MRTLIIIPTLGRPHRVGPLLENIIEATPEDHRVLFMVTETDHATQAAVVGSVGEMAAVRPYRHGDYAKKINSAYHGSREPYLFTGADDLFFHPGWLTKALDKMTPGIGVVGTNDLANRRTVDGDHSTHSLVSREYADRGLADGGSGILWEGYVHNFVDDELIATAKHRAAYAKSDAIVEHMHPNWGTAPHDTTYDVGRKSFTRDRQLYKQRQRLWI